MEVAPGTSGDDIINRALYLATNIRISFFNLVASAKRVVWFYKLIFRKSPVLVISIQERLQGQNYASVVGAARTLTEKYQFRVLLDGSPNSIPDELLRTGREIVMYIDKMPRKMIEKLDQLKYLFSVLQDLKLVDVTWEVLGGVPSLYDKMWEVVQLTLVTFVEEFKIKRAEHGDDSNLLHHNNFGLIWTEMKISERGRETMHNQIKSTYNNKLKMQLNLSITQKLNTLK